MQCNLYNNNSNNNNDYNNNENYNNYCLIYYRKFVFSFCYKFYYRVKKIQKFNLIVMGLLYQIMLNFFYFLKRYLVILIFFVLIIIMVIIDVMNKGIFM